MVRRWWGTAVEFVLRLLPRLLWLVPAGALWVLDVTPLVRLVDPNVSVPDAVLWALIALGVVAALIHTYGSARAERIALASKVAAYETPRLSLTFDASGSCYQPYYEGPNEARLVKEVYRVRIDNVSRLSIHDVTVSLLRFHPQGIDFGPAPLHLMWRDPSHEESSVSFTVNPNVPRYVSVVFMRYGADVSKEVGISYAGRAEGFIPSDKTYTFTLVAEGHDVGERCEREFRVWVENGKLRFANAPDDGADRSG